MSEHPRLAPPLEPLPGPPSGPPSGPPGRPHPPNGGGKQRYRRRTPIIVGAVVVLVLLAAGVTALGLHTGSHRHRDATPTTPGVSTSGDPAQRAQERLDAAVIAARRWYAAKHPDRSVMGIGVEQIEGDPPGQTADVVIGASVNAGAKNYASIQVYWDRVRLLGEDATWSVTGDEPIVVPASPDAGSVGAAAPDASQAAGNVVSAFFGYDTDHVGRALARMRAVLHPDGRRTVRPYLTSLRKYAARNPGITIEVQPVTVGFTEVSDDEARAVVLFRATGHTRWQSYQPERWVAQLALRRDHGVWKAVDIVTVSGPDHG